MNTTAKPQQADSPHAALLIDFDNVTMGVRSDLQEQLRNLINSEIFRGKVSVQRAYADWRRYPQYIVPLSEASIDLIFAPAFGANKKNATDIRLAIDALELVFTRPEIGTFILLSGDSDFSSLVLKLKEYGKYVIGVGLRESASDLLVQNCDEYYSYAEVTGFTREGEEEEELRRDAWELVVEAAVQMTKEDGVMRSDRLKQVMQEIDPHFSEKDAGFNRFGKFVAECGKRGLLDIRKMDNGQFQVSLGSEANVPPELEEVVRKQQPEDSKQNEKSASSGRGGRRRGGRDRNRERERSADKGSDRPPEPDTPSESDKPASEAKREKKDDKSDPLSMSEGFDLIKKALTTLGPSVHGAWTSETVRDEVMEVSSRRKDPLFEKGRFNRLLRQAHDAEVVEVVRDDDGYLVRMKDDDKGKPSGSAEKASTEESGTEEETPRRKRTRSRGRKRREDSSDSASESEDDAPEPGRETVATSSKNEGKAPAAESEQPVNDRPVEPEQPKSEQPEPEPRHSGPRLVVDDDPVEQAPFDFVPGPLASDGSRLAVKIEEVKRTSSGRASLGMRSGYKAPTADISSGGFMPGPVREDGQAASEGGSPAAEPVRRTTTGLGTLSGRRGSGSKAGKAASDDSGEPSFMPGPIGYDERDLGNTSKADSSQDENASEASNPRERRRGRVRAPREESTDQSETSEDPQSGDGRSRGRRRAPRSDRSDDNGRSGRRSGGGNGGRGRRPRQRSEAQEDSGDDSPRESRKRSRSRGRRGSSNRDAQRGSGDDETKGENERSRSRGSRSGGSSRERGDDQRGGRGRGRGGNDSRRRREGARGQQSDKRPDSAPADSPREKPAASQQQEKAGGFFKRLSGAITKAIRGDD